MLFPDYFKMTIFFLFSKGEVFIWFLWVFSITFILALYLNEISLKFVRQMVTFHVLILIKVIDLFLFSFNHLKKHAIKSYISENIWDSKKIF